MKRCFWVVGILGWATVSRAEPTHVHLLVDDTLTCPTPAQVAKAVRRRLPPDVKLDNGPADVTVRIEGTSNAQIKITISGGATAANRSVAPDPEHCQSFADSVGLLVESWARGHLWWPTAEAEETSTAPATAAAPATTDLSVQRQLPERRRADVKIGARLGVGFIGQRLTSNGIAVLTNYQATAPALAVTADLGYWHRFGRHFVLGVDTRYDYAGAAGFRYAAGSGLPSTVQGVEAHGIDAGVSGGFLMSNVLGGLLLQLHLGLDWKRTLVQPVPGPPTNTSYLLQLPSDDVLGMTVGLGIQVPALARIADRPLGLRLYGAAVTPPSKRMQTAGFVDGTDHATYGAEAGVTLSLPIYRALYAVADYRYSMLTTHFSGMSERDGTSTEGDRREELHLVTVGAAYVF